IALPAAGIRGGGELAVLILDRGNAAERPVGRDRDLVPALAQALDDPGGKPGLELQRPPLEAARIERRDQVIGVELGCVNRLLQVQPASDVTEKDVEGPLFLAVAARRAPGEPGLAVAQGETGQEGRAWTRTWTQRRRQPLLQPE